MIKTLSVVAVLLTWGCNGSHTRDGVGDEAQDAGIVLMDAAVARVDATQPDAQRPRDGGAGPDACACGPADSSVPVQCDRAMDVHVNACVDLDCGGEVPASRFFWNGAECVAWPSCTACEGSDCGSLMTRDACESAYASCTPQLCRGTGGTWHAELEHSGHYECGHESPFLCGSAGMPACDCGIGKVFDETAGCVASPSCDQEDLCVATRGRWGNYCVDACGAVHEPGPEDGACEETCDCGLGNAFDEASGCAPISSVLDVCLTPTPEQRCVNGGGLWAPGCGSPCGIDSGVSCACDDCHACVCPRGQNFDDALGRCKDDPACPSTRQLGEACAYGAASSKCDPSLVCCTNGIGGSACEAAQCSEYGPCGPPRP